MVRAPIIPALRCQISAYVHLYASLHFPDRIKILFALVCGAPCICPRVNDGSSDVRGMKFDFERGACS